MPNPNPRNVTPALDNAANAIKAGRIRQGRSILEEVLRTEPDNVLALLWMTRCVDDPSQKLVLFNRVLSIDPQNPHARKGLALYSPPPLPPSTSQPTVSRGLAVIADTPPIPASVPDTRLCPFCAETIRAQATVCRFCGRDLPQGGAGAPQSQAAPTMPPRKSHGWLPVVLVLALLTVAIIGCIFASSVASVFSDLRGSTPLATPQLPNHRVNDVLNEGQTTWLFIVADPTLSEASVRALVDYYRDKYSGRKVLNISVFCDDKYASSKYVLEPTISDEEFYAHVLGHYMDSPIATVFWTPANPYVEGQASACK